MTPPIPFCYRNAAQTISVHNMYPGPPPLILNDQDSTADVEQMPMKCWFDNFQRNHTVCNETQKDFLPTRLLDLKASEVCNDVRLVSLRLEDFLQSKDSDTVLGYMTLSH